MPSMTTEGVEPSIEESIEIAAPPATVWGLVSDPRNMARWSPQCVKTFVRGGQVRRGTATVNINRKGLLFWPTQAKVTAYEPESEFAFRIRENLTTWYYRLEATEGGTRLTAGRDATKGTTKLSAVLVDKVLGGQSGFQSDLRSGLRQTLQGIKSDAER